LGKENGFSYPPKCSAISFDEPQINEQAYSWSFPSNNNYELRFSYGPVVYRDFNRLETNFPKLSGGSSGGAVFNYKKEVIGVMFAGWKGEDRLISIPIRHIYNSVLRRYGKAKTEEIFNCNNK
jgi:hypothetical protein